MACSTASRNTVLKALRKSNCKSTWSGGARAAQLRSRWTISSAPRGTPTPSCSGASLAAASAWYRARSSLPANRRTLSPTAIGRTPPPFFPRGMSRAAARAEAVSGTRRPQAKSLHNRASCNNNLWYDASGFWHLRCWGMRPDTPPDEPGGKERRHSSTSSTEKSSPTGATPKSVTGESFCGCKAANVEGKSGGSGCCSCDKMRAALPKAPSRTARRAALRVPSGRRASMLDALSPVFCARPVFEVVGSPRYSRTKLPIWPAAHRARRPAMTATVCLQWRRPPRPVGYRIMRQKAERRHTAAGVESAETSSSSIASAEKNAG
jgi:hypothetical protein